MRLLAALAWVFSFGIGFDQRPARAGCAVPEPQLWLPSALRTVAINSRVTLSLGGYAGMLRGIELRPVRGSALAFHEVELPGPLGGRIKQLIPDQPLVPETRYEVVASRPSGQHPSRWVFGSFATGSNTDHAAPQFDVKGVRHYEELDDAGGARRWIELDVSVSDEGRSDAAVLFAVWLPDARGRLNLEAPPDVHLPLSGSTLRIGSLELCSGLQVTLPALGGRAEVAVAALDAASNRSEARRVAIDFGAPERRSPK